MGSAAGAQGGPMRPQPPQQKPMGPQQRPQGKGPGLPMPQQPNMGGQKPYQPVGANNGPFHQNPVAPVQQPMQGQFIAPLLPQGKGGVAQPARPIPPGQIDPGYGYMPDPTNPNTNFGSATSPLQPGSGSLMDLVKNAGGQPMNPHLIPQPPSNPYDPSRWQVGANGQPIRPAILPPQQPNLGFTPQPTPGQQPNQGKGPQSPFNIPAQTGPVQPLQQPNQGKGPGVSNPMNQPGMGPMGPNGPGTFA